MTSHDLQQWSGSRFAKGGCTPGDEKKASAIFVGGLLLSGLQLVPLNPTDPTAALKYSRYNT
jgi:hypothetical protein